MPARKYGIKLLHQTDIHSRRSHYDPVRGYNWTEWMDGDVWAFDIATEITTKETLDSFRHRCYHVARDKGLKVKTKTVHGTFYIQAYNPPVYPLVDPQPANQPPADTQQPNPQPANEGFGS